LKWEELTQPPHREILEWHRDLIALRARTPELRDGRMDAVNVSFDEGARWLTVTRGPIVVASNLSNETQFISVATGVQHRIAMASDARIMLANSTVQMPPDSVAILVS
jgi:maltooligosyltrehalose trehalohydrolase